MTPQDLRAEIITVLGDSLGTYTFSEGQTTPAIGIDDGSEPFVEQPDRTGLEVIIQPDQDLELEPMLAGDKRLNASVYIVLKQWDIEETTKAARELLIRNLPIDRVESISPRASQLEIIEVCTLAISDDVHFFS